MTRSLSNPQPADDPGDRLSTKQALDTALRGLAERDREILMLVAWEGLEAEEAAAALGCSRSSFAVRLHRARKRLVKELAAGGHEQQWRPSTKRSAEEA